MHCEIFFRIHIHIFYQPLDKQIGMQHNWPPQNAAILSKMTLT